MERFGTMTDEEYDAAFANYDNLTHHEKIGLVRRVALELQTFMDAKDNLADIATIRRFVQLLPSIQQRQVRMNVLAQQLKAM